MNLDLTPWRVKKLDDDSFAYLVPDAQLTADAKKMCVKVIVSTETMDRERDILIAKGCDTTDHKRNPIVLLNHRKDWPGIAQAQDPDGRYTVKAFEDHIEAVNWFNQDSKLALQSFRLIESGALRGVSPGFLTVPGQVHKIKAADGHPAFIYNQWKLVEITHCPIGMNPDALVLAVEKGFGGEALLPELKDALIPYMPEKKAQVVSGWKEKADDDTPVVDSDIDLSDVDAVALTPSTQYYHAIYQKAYDFLDMAQTLGGTQELERTKADGRRIVSLIGGILDTCTKGHGGHVNEFPDQPGLPGNLNEDVASKMMGEWRVKALQLWDEHQQALKQAVAAENAEDIQEAVKFCRTLANDRQLRTQVRAVAKQMANRLENVQLVSIPQELDDDHDWAAIKDELVSAKSRLDTIRKEKVAV